jgi:ABC-2 type transport system ATP-binding protein
MDEASRCHRIGFMQAGRLLVEGSPMELRDSLAGRIVEVRGGALAELRKRTQNLAGVEDLRAFGDRIHLRVKPGKAGDVCAAIEQKTRTTHSVSARIVPPSLEDVFIHLSQGKGGGAHA